MRYWARVNDAGFLQVRHSGQKPPHADYIEVSEDVKNEPGFYDIIDGKTIRKSPDIINGMLERRNTIGLEERIKRLENITGR